MLITEQFEKKVNIHNFFEKAKWSKEENIDLKKRAAMLALNNLDSHKVRPNP